MFLWKNWAGRAAVGLFALGGVGGTWPPSYAAPAPKVHTVVMNKMVYGRAPSGVRVGDVIVWVNKDIFQHTVTAPDKRYSVDLAPGATARTRITKSGTIDYYCIYHPGMKGRIVAAS